jgi:molybdenum transport protein
MFYTQTEIERFIIEDVPLHDETSNALSLPDIPGSLTYAARQQGVLAGMAPLLRMAQTLGLRTETLASDGDITTPGQPVMRLHGGARTLHIVWRSGINLLEYLGGIATATRDMRVAARQGNPQVQIAGTRKTFPGARKLQHYAVLCGGGMLHRASLSETILVFAQHRTFLPGRDIADLVHHARAHSLEKFIMCEAEDEQDALAVVRAGADGVQLDKMSPERLAALAPLLRSVQPRIIISAAGGVCRDNAAQYAASGVDVLGTSSLYTAKTSDFSAVMQAS